MSATSWRCRRWAAAAAWRGFCPATDYWRQRVAAADVAVIEGLLGDLPESWMSRAAKKFVVAMLTANRQRILDLECP